MMPWTFSQDEQDRIEELVAAWLAEHSVCEADSDEEVRFRAVMLARDKARTQESAA